MHCQMQIQFIFTWESINCMRISGAPTPNLHPILFGRTQYSFQFLPIWFICFWISFYLESGLNETSWRVLEGKRKFWRASSLKGEVCVYKTERKRERESGGRGPTTKLQWGWGRFWCSLLLGSLEYGLFLSAPPWLNSNSAARVWGREPAHPPWWASSGWNSDSDHPWPLNLQSMEKPSAKEHPEPGHGPPPLWGGVS